MRWRGKGLPGHGMAWEVMSLKNHTPCAVSSSCSTSIMSCSRKDFGAVMFVVAPGVRTGSRSCTVWGSSDWQIAAIWSFRSREMTGILPVEGLLLNPNTCSKVLGQGRRSQEFLIALSRCCSGWHRLAKWTWGNPLCRVGVWFGQGIISGASKWGDGEISEGRVMYLVL